MTGNSAITQEVSFLISKDKLILHDDAKYNLLAKTAVKEYFQIRISPEISSFSWVNTDSHMRVMFSLNLDLEASERTSYTLVQLISDLGGFCFCLLLIFKIGINGFLMMNVSLDNLLMNKVFRRRVSNSMNLAYVKINYRQFVVALFSSVLCLRRPRHELWRRVSMRRINRELDLSNFLRK